MWTPTRRKTGEGSTDREEPSAGARHDDNHRAPIRSAGVVSTACRKGNRASVGEARDGRGSRAPRRRQKGRRTIWASERVRCTCEPRVTPGEERTLASGMFVKKERDGN
jgi:hypothetical protein